MRHIALTGGLATGKSFVRGVLEALGVLTWDADAAAHTAVRPGTPSHHAIVERFGEGVLDVGVINRQKLAVVVFADATAREDLEAIVHPVVRRARNEWFADLSEQEPGFAVSEIPLLFEAGLEGNFDAVVVAACGNEVQVERAVSRGDLTEHEARLRINAQMSIADKVRRVDHVIWTDGSPDETAEQVRALYGRLEASSR
jgi:dephospho-CoA kinase